MKNLKKFNNFIKESSQSASGNYLKLEPVDDGLWIHLTPEGRQELLEMSDRTITDDDFYELFDEIRANSEYVFHSDMGESGFGLTNAPGFTDGYFYNDDSKYEATDDTAEIYWFPNYMVEDFIETLRKDGKVFFEKG